MDPTKVLQGHHRVSLLLLQPAQEGEKRQAYVIGPGKDPKHTWRYLVLSSDVLSMDETRTNHHGFGWVGWEKHLP